MMNNIFYHASNIGNLKELLPLSTLHGNDEMVCYFTPIRAYALFYLRDMEINHVTCGITKDGLPIYHEQFECQLETLYHGRSGFIYVCENNNNLITSNTNGIWIAKESVTILCEEFIPDVYAEILKIEQSGVIQIIRYNTLSEEKKIEITDMMKNSIIKHDYVNKINSPKSQFFKTHFSRSWEIALQEIDNIQK